MPGTPQGPNAGSSSNPVPSPDIRRSILEWTNKTVPRPIYTGIKGVSRQKEKGYVWICTVFSGAIPPTPDLGDTSDIYLDTYAKIVYIKIKPSEWTSWLPDTHIAHPLGGRCAIYPHFNHGIRWQTNVAFTSHRHKFDAVRNMTIDDIFRKTFVYHPYLDPSNPQGVGRVGLGKEVRATKGKKKASCVTSPSGPNPRDATPAPLRDPSAPIDDVASAQPPPPSPKDPTPQPVDDHQDIDMDFDTGAANEDINMDFNGGAEINDHQPRPLDKNKRRRLDSGSSSGLPSLSPSPEPSFLSKLIAAPIPLFKKLLEKPNIWLNLLGIQFPRDAQIIRWVNGVWTVIPWQKCDESIGENPDVVAVKHMSEAPDVTNPDEILCSPGDPRLDRFEDDPTVVVMEWTPDLRGPRPSSSDDDLLGHSTEAIAEHTARYSEWLRQLQKHLAAARYVIVRGWFPNAKTNWDVASIAKFKGGMDQKIEIQDAQMRAEQYHLDADAAEEGAGYHKTLPFREFVEAGIDKPSVCGNCLDSPGLRAEVPPFIIDIADCTRAYELTRANNAARLPLCVSKEATTDLSAWLKKKKKGRRKDTKDMCGKCEDIANMNEQSKKARMAEKDGDWDFYESSEPAKGSRPRHELPQPQEDLPEEPLVEDKSQKALGWMGHVFQKFTNFSPFSIAWDTWKASLWDLFTHAGFFTYVHHDGAGFCTYAFVRTGCKIWGIHRPMVTAKENTRFSVFDIMRKILRPHGHTSYIEYSDLYSIFLMPGDVLIQPPNMIHQVYTPVNCVASGGHLLNWSTLHLTEISKAFDHFYCHTATNADHESSFRTLCRMTMSLPIIAKSKTFLRRPILALAAMILWPSRYEPDPESSEERPRLAIDDIHRLEVQADHKAALEIIRKIMFIHDLTEESIKEEVFVGGVEWAKAGDVEIDLSAIVDR